MTDRTIPRTRCWVMSDGLTCGIEQEDHEGVHITTLGTPFRTDAEAAAFIEASEWEAGA